MKYELDLRGRPPALLTMADYCGTLAAARILDDHGVRVSMADPGRLAPAKWSRHVAQRLSCPPIAQPEALVAWLRDFGERQPGHVLYPTCDEYAWLIALHAPELRAHYRLYSPPVEAIEALLDKESLQRLCDQVGIETPRAWYPREEKDLEAIAREASFPLLVKQRTQILSTTHTKGLMVAGPAELPARYREFMRTNDFGEAVLARMPGVRQPLLQAYFPEAIDGSLLVAGFIDRSGELFVARASNKLLQIPPRLGIALCLEEAPLAPDLAERIARLCRAAGYYGVFQMEFIRSHGQHLLIDFNPRYYHHLAFEIARGMPLPIFAHLAACGEEAALANAVRAAVEPASHNGRIFTHRVQLETVLLCRRLSGRVSAMDAATWRRRYRAGAVDAMWRPGDLLPSLIDAALYFKNWARYPRSFFRAIALDR